MAFSNPHSNSASIAASAASVAFPVNTPSLGQLLIAGCVIYSTGTAPVISVTDNGSAGWNLINSVANPSSDLLYLYWWYKQAASVDVSSLNTVDFSWTNASGVQGGSSFTDEYDGFIGTPTLDIIAPHAAVNAGTVTVVGGVAAQTTELALGIVGTKAAPGATTGTNTYSPNAGTNTYNWTSIHSAAGGNNSTLIRTWAAPTATPATASDFIMTWTNSGIVTAFGATFFDSGGASASVSPLQAAGTGVGVGATPQVIITPPAATGIGVGSPTSSVVLDVVPLAATGTGVGVGATANPIRNVSPLAATGTGVGAGPFAVTGLTRFLTIAGTRYRVVV